MDNPVIGQKVKYKGKKYLVLKSLGDDRYDLKCACGSKVLNVHKDDIHPL